MLYALHGINDQHPLLLLEADSVDDAWKQVHNTGIKNAHNQFTIDELCQRGEL